MKAIIYLIDIKIWSTLACVFYHLQQCDSIVVEKFEKSTNSPVVVKFKILISFAEQVQSVFRLGVVGGGVGAYEEFVFVTF